jgi:hypothetical protein
MAAPWRTRCFRSAAHDLGAGGVVTGELGDHSAGGGEGEEGDGCRPQADPHRGAADSNVFGHRARMTTVKIIIT